ncbi:ankyrin repeat domain-containing protein [Seonamhaeicola maritimus]|uniref:Ankyrin repeat domain-containing protein n=1 Tax=Seonamhaeicola maritimus TaxID=2591822 RepID=A0A5C7GKJ6_9FLAO|nr:ankyrin repeat domain-containing protein [Seonamhaeicola maritimus]TXG38735.1 ankyrin repeat domain-containing protein [Seonamhaeicola maritimus]
MKKTIITTALALCVAVFSVNATPATSTIENSTSEYFFKVNSFCVSIAKGDFDTVQKLIERGADVNERSNGMTPAMYAAKFNRTEILNLLISKGANLKLRCSNKSYTAAKYAELHGADDAATIIKETLKKKKKK